MNDFRTQLQVAQNDSSSRGIRLFYPFIIGKSELSIQASQHHYCSPRQTLPVTEYEAWELYFVTQDPKAAEMARGLGVDVDTAIGWVTTENVQQFIDALTDLVNLGGREGRARLRLILNS